MIRVAVAALLLVLASLAHGQSADLTVLASASTTIGLRLGDEIVVSTVVRNQGPDAALDVSIAAGQEQWELFLYELLASESPACGPIEQIDFDPPQYNFSWRISSLAPGEAITCAARLRVIRVPTDYASRLFAGARGSPAAPDPMLDNNNASFPVTFAQPAAPQPIPVASWWASVLMVAGVLVLRCTPHRRDHHATKVRHRASGRRNQCSFRAEPS